MPPLLAGIFRLRGLSEEVHNRFELPHNGKGGKEGETGKVDLSAFPTCWLSERRKDGFGIVKRQLPATVQLPEKWSSREVIRKNCSKLFHWHPVQITASKLSPINQTIACH